MNAEFFALAFLAGLNPKLLALDLLLIENRRPRAMFLWLLVGGLTVGVTIGLLDVLVFHIDAINHQGSVSAGVDLALGLLLLAAGALAATGRLHGRRKAPVPVGDRQPEKPEKPEKKDSLAQRLLAEPRLGLAVLVGAVIGIPGASYLTALHHLVAGKYSTSTQVIAVVRLRLHRLLADHHPVRVPGTAARDHQGAAQAHPELAARPRPTAHSRRRAAPGRLPDGERSGPAVLTSTNVEPAGVVGLIGADSMAEVPSLSSRTSSCRRSG